MFNSIDKILKPKSEEDIIKSLVKFSKKELEQQLFKSCVRNEISKISLLLKHGVNVNCRDNAKRTPLIISALIGKEDLCKLLIQNGAFINAKDNKGESPLKKATIWQSDDVIELLKQNGAK